MQENNNINRRKIY